MSRGQVYSEQTRADCSFGERGGFGRPLGCVATAFTFDAAFEEQCLARFLALQSSPNETRRLT